MNYVQGNVYTRDHIFTAHGVDETDVREILIDLWTKHIKDNPALITTTQFIDRIEYTEFTIGTGQVQNNDVCMCHKVF